MARKSKRQSRRSGAATRLTPSATVSSTLSEREFNPDYSQTVKDLRRIGILAGTFITVLIALAIFLR